MNRIHRTLTYATVLAGLALAASPALSQGRGDRGERARPTAEQREQARQELQAKLDLSPAQAAQMDSIQTSMESRREALRESAGDGDRDAMREEMKQMREDEAAAIERVLSEDQLSRYKELRSEGRQGRGNRTGGRGERR